MFPAAAAGRVNFADSRITAVQVITDGSGDRYLQHPTLFQEPLLCLRPHQ